MKQRKPSSHKRDNGVVLVVGGSREYAGAVYLAAKSIAAMRTGTDLVIVAAPEKVAWSINTMSPDLITSKLSGEYITSKHKTQISKLLSKADVLLIGNGISQNKQTASFVKSLVEKTTKPKVIDADALKIIDLNKIKNAILTPHHKEFEILLKNSKLSERNFRAKLGNNIILLKGKTDKIISKNKIKLNKTGNAGMTVGGTGDVLSGLCAGFVSQGNSLFDSAAAAAHINGKIGNKLKKKLGYGFIASDFLAEIAKEAKRSKL